MLTQAQKQAVLLAMETHMAQDEYGRSSIRNVYLDTDNFRLIRRSLEKPAYKEKLRLRSYGRPDEDGRVFVELKKKYDGIVYKRREAMPYSQAIDLLSGGDPPARSQIVDEIRYFLSVYGALRPAMFLSYERQAYYCPDGSDFRVTFDENILARDERISLLDGVWGTPLLPPGATLMELKSSGGIPLWMVRAMTEGKIRQISFSKYGTAYEKIILGKDRVLLYA